MKKFAEYPAELAADFVERWEGFRETAYICPAGKLTIGFGHTGDDVSLGDVCTYHEAYELLVDDLRKHIADLAPHVSVPVTEGQFVALSSLAFNIGDVSRKCPKLMRALNAGDFEAAAHEFLDCDRAGGVRLAGLSRRRQAEARLFLGEV